MYNLGTKANLGRHADKAQESTYTSSQGQFSTMVRNTNLHLSLSRYAVSMETLLCKFQPRFEVLHHEREAFSQGHLRLPSQELLGLANVGLPLMRVIGGVVAESNSGRRIDHLLHNLEQRENKVSSAARLYAYNRQQLG
jgi:hypothetical protein